MAIFPSSLSSGKSGLLTFLTSAETTKSLTRHLHHHLVNFANPLLLLLSKPFYLTLLLIFNINLRFPNPPLISDLSLSSPMYLITSLIFHTTASCKLTFKYKTRGLLHKSCNADRSHVVAMYFNQVSCFH